MRLTEVTTYKRIGSLLLINYHRWFFADSNIPMKVLIGEVITDETR